MKVQNFFEKFVVNSFHDILVFHVHGKYKSALRKNVEKLIFKKRGTAFFLTFRSFARNEREKMDNNLFWGKTFLKLLVRI